MSYYELVDAWEAGKFDQAEACLMKLLAIEPLSLHYLLLYARLMHDARDAPRCFEAYKRFDPSILSESDQVAFLLAAEKLGPEACTECVSSTAKWSAAPQVRERLAFAEGRRGSFASPELGARVISQPAFDALTARSPLEGTLVIDAFLATESALALRSFLLNHRRWRDADDGGEQLSTVADGLACSVLFNAAEEIRIALESHFPRLAIASIWAYRYRSNGATAKPHADDGDISVNLWITPDRHCRQKAMGGLHIWNSEAPSNYFAAAPGDKMPLLHATAYDRAAGEVVAYRYNRAVVFKSRLVHQTQPYSFDETHEGRRMNVTFSFSR